MYSIDGADEVIELQGLPQSCCGAPMPAVFSDEHCVLRAYFMPSVDDPEEGSRVALVRFASPTSHMFGGPNDETLNGHPLYSKGLTFYGIHEVRNSSWIRALEKINSVHDRHIPEQFWNLKHFIFTFHDSTFECIAEDLVATIHLGSPSEVLMSHWTETNKRMRGYDPAL